MDQGHFSFVQPCDPQLGMGGYAHDVRTLKQAVGQINEMDIAFEDLLEIIDELNVPYYLVPGNHDIGNIPNDTTLDYYRNTIGEDYEEQYFNLPGMKRAELLEFRHWEVLGDSLNHRFVPLEIEKNCLPTAAEGVRCTDFYVPTPYCAPSRASRLHPGKRQSPVLPASLPRHAPQTPGRLT